MELSPILDLDIGGKRFRVLRATVMKYPNSLLARVITGKDTDHMMIFDKAYFFDRNPQYFSVILDYMRIGSLFVPPALVHAQLVEELKFWQLSGEGPVEGNSEYEATLVMPDMYQPTLVIPDYVEPTLLAQENPQPTILIPSPKIEPTLLIDDPPKLLIDVQETKSLEFVNKPETSPLKETPKLKPSTKETKFNLDDDDLLTSLIQDKPKVSEKPSSRTLPWSRSQDRPKDDPKKPKDDPKRPSKPDPKATSKSKSDFDPSFIDDNSSGNSEDPPFKRKPPKPEPKKLVKRNTSSTRFKKSDQISEEELLKALNDSNKH